MRRVNTMLDVQKALDELYSFRDSLSRGGMNFHGNRLSNVGKGIHDSDVAIVGQLPKKEGERIFVYEDVRTICFGPSGELVDEEDGTFDDEENNKFGWYKFGREMESDLLEVWIECKIPPPDADLIINIEYQLNEEAEVYNLIEPKDGPDGEINGLLYPQDAEFGVFTSFFRSPSPVMSRNSRIRPLIIQGGGASLVTVGVVVKRIIKQ